MGIYLKAKVTKAALGELCKRSPDELRRENSKLRQRVALLERRIFTLEEHGRKNEGSDRQEQ